MRLFANINPARNNGEVNTGNNIVTSGFAVQVTSASQLPDLMVDALSAPAAVQTSGSLSIADTVRNSGGAPAGSFTVGYYLDGAQGRTTLASRAIAGLPANGSSLESFTATLPSAMAPGTYTLTVQANASGTVQDANNGNDIATRTLTVTAAPPPSPSPPPPGTGGFEGFGAATPGGAGKAVYTVTSLGAAGPGTLADAVSQGNRYVTFAVAGVIQLTNPIRVKGSFITIDGFSAPAPGITLHGAGLYLMNKSSTYGFDYGTHDIIVRGIRVRNSIDDAFRVAYSAYNIVFDHVSASGAGDGSIDITEDSHDVTVQWSIFANPLSQKNSLIAYRAARITMHHNLFIDSDDRNPAVSFSYEGTPSSAVTLDFRNNVVWGWDSVGSRILYGSQANMVNNYYDPAGGRVWNTLIVCRPGASWAICNHGDPKLFARAYVTGNLGVGITASELNAAGAESAAFAAAPVSTQSACAAARQVQAAAGVLSHDAVDTQSLAAVHISSAVCP
jgi:hypothetical protein